MLCLETSYGLGHHTMFQSPSAVTPFRKASFSAKILYQLVLWLTKMGVCMFYRRIFQDNRSKRIINLTIGFVVITGVLTMLLAIFQCIPIEGAWDLEPSKCLPILANVYVSSICNILADIILLTFAIPRVSKSISLVR